MCSHLLIHKLLLMLLLMLLLLLLLLLLLYFASLCPGLFSCTVLNPEDKTKEEYTNKSSER